MWPPRRAKVFRKLCGLKYGSPAAAKAYLKIARIGPALLQCLRSSPDASKCRVTPTTILVAGNSGSSNPQSFSCLRYLTQSTTIWRMSSPTGKNQVVNDLENFVFTCRASWSTQPWSMFEGCDRPVAGAGQDREGNEGSIAALDLGAGRHGLDDVPDLLQGRHTRVPMRLGDPRLIFSYSARCPAVPSARMISACRCPATSP